MKLPMPGIKILLITLISLILSNPALSFAEVRKEYYPSGELERETNYKNGKVEGIFKVYYESGQLWVKQNYVNGKKDGIHKVYNEGGQLALKAIWKDGKAEGIQKVYFYLNPNIPQHQFSF